MRPPLLVPAAVLALGAGPALAVPRVCGNQAALGNFAPAQCPALHDDGMDGDEVAGDGIYTLRVQLAATGLLHYKILPSGDYGADEIHQAGECGPGGAMDTPTQDILVPRPDVGAADLGGKPALFYYDSRLLTDPSYAPPPGNRSGGDSIMAAAPADRPPQWIAVGDFQATPFDPPTGADLQPRGDGALAGQVTLGKDLPAGWQWKVFEKGRAYTDVGARKFGVNGWSYTPGCDSDNARVPAAAGSGQTVQLVFYPRTGRLQTLVQGGALDGPGGGPELGPAPADLAAPPGNAPDGALPAPGGADMAVGVLPGIHCHCQAVHPARPASPPGGALAAAGALLLLRWARRRSRPPLT